MMKPARNIVLRTLTTLGMATLVWGCANPPERLRAEPYIRGCDPDALGPCPAEQFLCTQDGAGNKYCESQDSATPDDGSWQCELIADGLLLCSGDHMPTDQSDWSCWEIAGQVLCTTDPTLPQDDGVSGDWSCGFEDDRIVCEANGEETPPSSDEPEPGGDNGNDGLPGEGDLPREEPEPGPTSEPAPGDGAGSCDPWVETTVRFGRSGELMALDLEGRYVDCTTVEVDITGSYAFYDDHIAESGATQLDETGFLTVTNSCNPAGLPESSNVGDYYVVQDVDNTVSCSSDAECAAGQACRAGNSGLWCVPEHPVYMGTFLLVAGEANELCVNHWCPLWRDGREGDGFVTGGCEGSVNSIHVALDGSMRVCFDPSSPELC